MQEPLPLSQYSEQLSKAFPSKMAIIDCETTGGKADYHRVIEIGVILVDNGKITQRWQSFIDPQRPLPPFITTLTGITAHMLEGQPKFADIAEELLQLLEGRVFVAHNARFDYSFIRNEFDRLGQHFSAKTLCSVKLSRALFPQFRKHSLEAIIQRFQFTAENRHRALDDAEMVWNLLLKSTNLLDSNEIAATCDQLLKNPSLPPHIKKQQIKTLPKSAGVYYFYDEEDALLYIGKSVNIQTRVMSHFSQDYRSVKERSMCQRIARIDYQRTPGDFGAQLLESQEIKRLSPIYNRRLRKVQKLFGLQLETLSTGYDSISIRSSMSDMGEAQDIGLFRSPTQASKRLEKLADDYFLCQKLLGLEGDAEDHKPCFRRQLKRCFGACEGAEPAEDYNRRVEVAVKANGVPAWPFSGPVLVKEQDQNDSEFQHAHLFDDWRYFGRIQNEDELRDLGFCAATPNHSLLKAERANDTSSIAFDLDIYRIILRFLLNEKNLMLNGLEIIQLTSMEC